MAKPWAVVNEVVDASDILLLLLDARMVADSRNADLEGLVQRSGKPLIYVITKCDLVEKRDAEAWKKVLQPCVFVSSTTYHGMTMLHERILVEASRAGIKHRIRVGVLGYPNAGKSSLVNAMTGRGAAQTSSLSGHTRSKKFVTSASGIIFVDTPGVIPLNEKYTGTLKHAYIGAIDYSKEKDPDLVVLGLLAKFPGVVEEFYGVEIHDDGEETIEEIARKCNVVAKGGVPDIHRASVMILKDWQTGAMQKPHKKR